GGAGRCPDAALSGSGADCGRYAGDPRDGRPESPRSVFLWLSASQRTFRSAGVLRIMAGQGSPFQQGDRMSRIQVRGSAAADKHAARPRMMGWHLIALGLWAAVLAGSAGWASGIPAFLLRTDAAALAVEDKEDINPEMATG